jgi:hypothetical protein
MAYISNIDALYLETSDQQLLPTIGKFNLHTVITTDNKLRK